MCLSFILYEAGLVIADLTGDSECEVKCQSVCPTSCHSVDSIESILIPLTTVGVFLPGWVEPDLVELEGEACSFLSLELVEV